MRSSFSVGFGVSMLATLVGLTATDAGATGVRTFSPTSCRVAEGSPGMSESNSSSNTNPNPGAGMFTTPGGSVWAVLLCPVVSDYDDNNTVPGSGGPLNAANTVVFAYGYSPAVGNIAVQDCVTYAGGAGGGCGALSFSTTSGVSFVKKAPVFSDPTGWKHGVRNDSYFVRISLAPQASLFSYALEH